MRNVLRHRSFLRGLTRQQRRKWFEQFKTMQGRAPIGGLYLPPAVRKSFTYVVLQ